MKVALVVVVVVHGLIHFLGPAKAFGLAALPELARPIARPLAIGWLFAGFGMLVTAAQLVWVPRLWWVTGLVASVLSQALIFSAWPAARFGTLANLAILAAAMYGLASEGPWSFRAAYRSSVAERLAPPSAMELLTENDLVRLPDPVARYVRTSGAVGRPRPWRIHACWKGRIRGGPDEVWMPCTAQQDNFLLEPSRFFLMKARRAALPVEVFHSFHHGRAAMRVRLLSLAPLVDARGPEMDRAETVTLFNDVALLAPGALVDSRIEWETVDDRSVRGTYTVRSNSVSATLHFAENGDLIDFVSDDRLAASPDGQCFEPRRWSTPITGHQLLGGLRVLRRGEGRWHPEGGEEYAYVELELEALELNEHG